MKISKCSVPGCARDATVSVRLFDVYPDGMVFNQEDFTCPFMCQEHVRQNEAQAVGERKGRGNVTYPHSNREGAVGFTVYDPLSAKGHG
jgi:hypothetical protein